MDFIILLLLILLIIILNYLSVKHKPKPHTPNPHTEAADLALYRYNKHQYLQSPEWAAKRKAALARAHYECEMCCTPTNLHVHHITYRNLYREKPNDLVALCPACHTRIHDKYGYPNSIKEYKDFHGPIIKLF
jgi:5-methylcytosine-specific restriction endonuclease McrA